MLAFSAVAAYVPLNTFIALKLGRVLERLTVRMQQAEGSYRSELTTLFRRSFHVAASRGEGVQKAMHDRLYLDIDRTWARLNRVNAGYMSFELVYNFVGARIVAYGPSLVPYMQNAVSLKGYITGAELVNSLISQCSWFIHVMPEIATLRAKARRVTELAEAIENVQQPREFYRQTGQSDFRYARQNAVFGLTVQNLELMHQGSDAAPFLTHRNLRFRRGEWTFVTGESGCGKTSLIKAINGLWAYGRGTVVFPEGVKTFYAAQDVKLPHVSLKELVCLPAAPHEYSDAQAAAALHKAGLGDFIEHLAEDAREGKAGTRFCPAGRSRNSWSPASCCSSRGCCSSTRRPARSTRTARSHSIRRSRTIVPRITVISIMHEAMPPKSATGAEFYDSVLRSPTASPRRSRWPTTCRPNSPRSWQTGPLEQPSDCHASASSRNSRLVVI